MKKRYIVYGLLILLVIQSIPKFGLTPALPVIQLPGEIVFGKGMAILGGITNTFIATILTFLLILGIAFALRPKSRSADEVPTGFYNFFEMLIEMAYGYVENASGKWARTFFPFFMTFILWITMANWMELIPGVDSIGKWEKMSELRVHEAEKEAEAKGEHLTEEEIHAIEVEVDEANEGHFKKGLFLISKGSAPEEEQGGADWTLVPFVRAAATDLNFTLAIAIISVVMTQYYGMKAQGMKYWGKFFIWDGDKIKKDPLAIIGSGVGLLEFVSEIFKIVSFAFRLLGNIFAGQVLLFVIGSLLPVANLLFWHLEFGVGVLQAVVFALLTLTFMKSATESHH